MVLEDTAMKLSIYSIWSTLWTWSMNSCPQEGTAKAKLATEMDERKATEGCSTQENRGAPDFICSGKSAFRRLHPYPRQTLLVDNTIPSPEKQTRPVQYKHHLQMKNQENH